MDSADREALLLLTTDVVAAYVSTNSLDRSELTALISDVHAALSRLKGGEPVPPPVSQEPAVPVRKSITPDYLVCLEDGKKFKSLKRHLRSDHNLSPEGYREKWSLKSDYPMVAPTYAKARSNLAKLIGLGQKGRPVIQEKAPVKTKASPGTAKPRARRSKSAS